MNPVKRAFSIGGVRWLLVSLALLAAMFLVFSSLDPYFGQPFNVNNMLRSAAPILLIGIGQSVVLVTGNIDLSIGSVVGMSCMTSATLLTKGFHPLAASAIALLLCIAFGLFNGELVARVKIPPYIATLSTMMICRGIAQVANGNHDTGYIGAGSYGFRQLFYHGDTLRIYNVVWIALLVWGATFFLLSKTRTGRHMYAIGNNLEASRLSGVNVGATVDKAYMLSAFTAGLAGLILVAQAGYGAMGEGNLYEVYAVGVAVIGGISTLGGRGLLVGTAVGSVIWVVLQNGLTRTTNIVSLQYIIFGIIVVVVVALETGARNRRNRL